MKTERRHELQENELANLLGDKIRKLKPYAMTIVGLGILLMLAVFVSAYMNKRSSQAKEMAWAAYFDAMATPDPASFESVAKNFAGTQAAGWALQTAGDLLLNQGIGQLYQDRERSKEQLAVAADTYSAVLADYADDTMLQQRATLGLAKVLESQGKFTEAEAKYADIVSRWGDSEIAQMANDRIADLKSPATQAWYTWFAAQTPAQSPLTDSSLFEDLPKLPANPDLSMPAPGQMLGGGESSDGGESDDGAPNDGGIGETPADSGLLNEGLLNDETLDLESTDADASDEAGSAVDPVQLLPADE